MEKKENHVEYQKDCDLKAISLEPCHNDMSFSCSVDIGEKAFERLRRMMSGLGVVWLSGRRRLWGMHLTQPPDGTWKEMSKRYTLDGGGGDEVRMGGLE